MQYRDYYKVLGVTKGCPQKEITSSYRKLARKYHPDLNPSNKNSEAKLKEINEAYEVLGDKIKREKYDQLGADWDKIHINDIFTNSRNKTRTTSRQKDSFGGFSNFFETFFGKESGGLWDNIMGGNDFAQRPSSNSQHSQRASKVKEMEYEITVTLEEAFKGVKRLIQVSSQELCPSCHSNDIYCPQCRGQGVVMNPRTLNVEIPKGVKDGSKIRIQGAGDKGDIFLKVKISPHKFFTVKENDLYADLPVMDYEAMIGTEVQIPTLGGNVTMKIPPETQADKTFRLKGQGLPMLKTQERGDMYIKIKIFIPTELNPQEKDLIKKFYDLRKSKNTDIRKNLF